MDTTRRVSTLLSGFALALVAVACSANPKPSIENTAGGSATMVTSPSAGSTGTSAGAGTNAAAAGRAASGVGGTGGAGTGTAGTSASSAGASAGTAALGGNGGVAGAAVSGSGGVAAAGSTGTAGMAAPSADCDRACLLKVMQDYLDALIAKDPSKLKVAMSLKYTENGVTAKLGDGLWKTVSKLVPDARLDFADPTLANVATQVLLNENGSTPVMYGVRLKVVNHEITEIEGMSVRQADAANGFFTPANLKPEAVFTQAIDPAKRMSRDDMLKLQNNYLDYLEGKKTGDAVGFDTNCKRYENGVATATGLSSFQLQSWAFQVTRRILIIDEEAGITWGMFPFQQTDSALVVGEAFKMIGGKIMMIQAIMANIPAKAWDTK